MKFTHDNKKFYFEQSDIIGDYDMKLDIEAYKHGIPYGLFMKQYRIKNNIRDPSDSNRKREENQTSKWTKIEKQYK